MVSKSKIKMEGWRDVSEVKNTDCSCRGLGFNSQYPHGTTQLSVTPVPGDPTLSHRHACRQNTNAYEIKISTFYLNERN